MSDRRVAFFSLAAVVCFALTPITFREHRWVPLVIGTLYALFAVGSWLDYRSRLAHERRRHPDREPT